MKNGKLFHLPKALIPIVTLILITSAIFFSLNYFISEIMELSDIRIALILAMDRMSDLNYLPDTSVDGSSTYREIAGNSYFTVKTAVFTLSENERELSVEVTSSSGEIVELVRRIYLDYRNGIEIKLINN